MADNSVYIFVTIFSIVIGILLIQWFIAVARYLIIPNWNKIKDGLTNVILGVFGVMVVIFFVWLFFHDCKGDENMHNDIDHVHFEKY